MVTLDISIKDQLHVFQPSAPEPYQRNRELVPGDLLDDLGGPEIVVINFHTFRRCEETDLS